MQVKHESEFTTYMYMQAGWLKHLRVAMSFRRQLFTHRRPYLDRSPAAPATQGNTEDIAGILISCRLGP